MFISMYALAVEIEDNLFEIFDILYFEKDTEIDFRYKKAISFGATGIYKNIRDGIKINAILQNDSLVSDSNEETFSIDENENIYLFISNNRVFGFIINQKHSQSDEKYQAAFSSNVILIDISLEKNVGLGDLWDGQKIVSVI